MASKLVTGIVLAVALFQCCTWVQAAEPAWNITTASIQSILNTLEPASGALENATQVINNASQLVKEIEDTLNSVQDELKKGGSISDCKVYKLYYYLQTSGNKLSTVLNSLSYPTLQPLYSFVNIISTYNLENLFGISNPYQNPYPYAG